MKLTREQVIGHIKKVEYIEVAPKQTIVAVAHLHNGHVVIGEAHCLDPDDFDTAKGELAALGDVERKLWPIIAHDVRSVAAASDLRFLS